MDFHKVETTSNFDFGASEARQLTASDHGSSVFRVTLASSRWPRGTDSQALLTPQEFQARPSKAQLTLGPAGEIDFQWEGVSLLRSKLGRGFGVCGSKWVMAFEFHEADRFYGLGQKHLGLELSRRRTKFWNTDEFGDFPASVVESGRPDPSYASFPVLIVRHADLWAAVVIDNPHGVFVNTGATESIFQPGAGPFVPELFFGSRDGAPDVWFLADATPAGLVRNIQALQGRVEPPPVWALGHHQCRWGYRNHDDLKRLADAFEHHEIPNDGLWLDIDYMDGFRVFTVDPAHFLDLNQQLADLASQGYRVVPILDPGLRQDPEYPVYAAAKEADLLCHTPEGGDYVGYVWPGYTVFPDFSLPETREFWANQVKALTDRGFGGYWIDMNDPSTGSVPHDDMRFGRGSLPHSAYHNQYALGMAEGTKRGLKASRPNERPFVLSRSAYLSSGRHTALWMGDNVSNEHHLKTSVPMALNLSISGMPFVGPDVPGFAGDASNELMRTWYKLGFLFPFFRNHSIKTAADQEPWSRDGLTTRVVTEYIRLRYKLLPYLYQTFLQQSEAGDPILRPVWYHDPSPAFDRTEDMFYVGDSLLQAPFTTAEANRTVLVPRHARGNRWYDVQNRRFVEAGEVTRHRNTAETTPLFLASPSLLPLQRGVRKTNANELQRLDLLILLEAGQMVEGVYQYDDGLTEAWREGRVSRFEWKAQWEGDRVAVTLTSPVRALGGLNVRFVVLSPQKVEGIRLNGKPFGLSAETQRFAGSRLRVWASVEIEV